MRRTETEEPGKPELDTQGPGGKSQGQVKGVTLPRAGQRLGWGCELGAPRRSHSFGTWWTRGSCPSSGVGCRHVMWAA